MDWTVDAAIIALTALAQTDPGIVGEVFELFLDLVRNQPRPGHVCYLWTVIYCIQQLPGLANEYRDWAADYQRQMEADQPKGDRSLRVDALPVRVSLQTHGQA